MPLDIGKSRSAPNAGLSVSISAPISEIDRIQFNSDGTLTVLVNFWESQAAFDDVDIGPYDRASYQITEPAALKALLETELKTLPDFDSVV